MDSVRSKGHRVFINTVSNFTAVVCHLAISFFMAPFLVHRLGDSTYGLWAIVTSIFGYMGLLDLGLSSSLVRHIASYDSDEKRHLMGTLLSSALLFYACAGVLGAMIGVSIGLFGMSVFNIPESIMGQARLTMVIMGVSSLLVFPGHVFTGLLSGLRLYYKTRTAAIVWLGIKTAAIVVAIRSGKGLVWLAIIVVGTEWLRFLTIYLLAKQHLRGVPLRIRGATKQGLRDLLSYGAKVFATMGLRTTSYGSDRIVIGIILSIRWVTFFSIPLTLIHYLKTIPMSLTGTLMPVFSNLESRKLHSEIRARVVKYSRYLAAIVLFSGLGVLIQGTPFIAIWMGPSYAERGEMVLVFLSLSYILLSLVPCSERLLMGTGNQGILLCVAIVHAPLRLGLSIFLVHVMGIAGVALADFVCEAGARVYLLVRVSRYLEMSVKDHLQQTLLRPFVVCAIAASVLWGTKTIAYPHTYLGLMIQVALACAVFFPLVYLVVLTREERLELKWNITRKLLRRTLRGQPKLMGESGAPLDAGLPK